VTAYTIAGLITSPSQHRTLAPLFTAYFDRPRADGYDDLMVHGEGAQPQRASVFRKLPSMGHHATTQQSPHPAAPFGVLISRGFAAPGSDRVMVFLLAMVTGQKWGSPHA
jgi:hypothetical protein